MAKKKQSESVYRIIDVVGVSEEFWEMPRLYSFTIGFVGAILFLLVDKYEPEGPLARLLKFSDPVRRWRRDPAQVAALRSRAVLAEILLS